MSPIEHQLDHWGLLPRHQQMTELFASDPEHLPKTYAPGQSQTVAFSVHNLTNTTATYHYTITAASTPLAGQNTGTTLATGSVQLGNNNSRQINTAVQLSDLGKHIYIQVQLSSGQTIGYWLSRE
jgi:hypothetical protein